MAWGWPFKPCNETHGGYPLFAVVLVHNGIETVFKTHVRADKAIVLAKSLWKNNQPLDEVWCVNMKLGTRRDIIQRDIAGER